MSYAEQESLVSLLPETYNEIEKLIVYLARERNPNTYIAMEMAMKLYDKMKITTGYPPVGEKK